MSTEENKNPKYLDDFIQKWELWTGIEDPEVAEAIRDISGDLHYEIRKFQSQLLSIIESFEKELNVEVRAQVEQPDGSLRGENVILLDFLKSYIKVKTSEMWRDIISHQNVGVDKLCLVTRKYLDDEKIKKQKKHE